MKKLSKNLEAILLTAQEDTYPQFRSSCGRKGSPQFIFLPTTDEEVAEVLAFVQSLRQEGDATPLSIMSGGHGITNASTNDGGIVLNLSKMNKVQLIDEKEGLVSIQAGARWGQVAAYLAPYDLIMTSGNFGDVGVGGLTVAGGIGYFTKTQGLTIDRLVGATVVTADGHIYHVNEEKHADLFWAIRGGMTQVGLVTEFHFQAHRMNSPEGNAAVGYQEIDYMTDDLSAFLDKWQSLAQELPDQVASFLTIAQMDQQYYIHADNLCASHDQDFIHDQFSQFERLAPSNKNAIQIASYAQIIPFPKDTHDGSQPVNVRNILADRFDDSVKQAIIETVQLPSSMAVEVRTIGGYMNTIADDATAFSNRSQQVFIACWLATDDDVSALRSIGTGCYGAYSSSLDKWVTDLTWSKPTQERLKELSNQYDPLQVFNTGLQIID